VGRAQKRKHRRPDEALSAQAPAAASVQPSPAGILSSRALAVLVALVTAAIYLPALRCGFVSWDDPEVVLENLHIRRLDLASLRWMLGTFHTGNWIPLTWLSHALVVRFFGLDPRAHHLVNVLLHALDTALVFGVVLLLLQRAREQGAAALDARRGALAAALTALLFGLHPLHVESVAWVSERKDVLYAFFFLLAVGKYLKAAADGPRRRERLWLTALLFLLALLAKPMAVTLPLVLLILDYWPLGRFPGDARRAWLEKLPLLAIMGCSALLTLVAQSSHGAVVAVEAIPFDFRVLNAFHSLVFYAWKLVLPTALLPLYPISDAARRAWSLANLASAAAVLFVSACCLAYGVGRRAYLSAAWLYYLVTLAPVLGIVQVGEQAAADRYSYLPSLGPLALVAAGLAATRPGLGLATALLAALAGLSVRQIGTWRDSVTLWERVVAAYPDVSAIAHTNMANAYKSAQRPGDALREYRRALAAGPPHAFIYDGLGTALLDLGQADDAIAAFGRAIAMDSSYAKAYRNLWFAYTDKGDASAATAAIEKAVSIDPEFADAWSNLGISRARAGRLGEAEAAFRRAIALDPQNAGFATNLGVALLDMGRAPEAREALRRALTLGGQPPAQALRRAGIE
jgi:tetratricopeptide (TPR) repeat protein